MNLAIVIYYLIGFTIISAFGITIYQTMIKPEAEDQLRRRDYALKLSQWEERHPLGYDESGNDPRPQDPDDDLCI